MRKTMTYSLIVSLILGDDVDPSIRVGRRASGGVGD